MDELVRHFVTPVLGRGVVTAARGDDGNLYVEVTYSRSTKESRTVRMRVSCDDRELAALSQKDLLFRTCRAAISRTQNMATEGEIPCTSVEELSLNVRPWKGDLTEVPFGGPTIGCVRLF